MKTLTGKVVSKKTAKTLIVEVEKQRIHPLYKKIMRSSKRYKVHDEKDIGKLGDIVKIVSTRPLSKDKYFKIEESLK